MKNWTLINEFGDRIERISQAANIKTKKVRFSYRGFMDGQRFSGHLNKVKKTYNDFRGVKTTWKEVWE